MTETKLRDDIARLARSLFDRGLTFGSTGNISVRLENGGWLGGRTAAWGPDVIDLLERNPEKFVGRKGIPFADVLEKEIASLVEWFSENLGNDVPLHFSAFHPDFKMLDVPRTPISTLVRAREQAKKAGLHHVYTGNVHDHTGQSTYCSGCDALLIGRDWYRLGTWSLDERGACKACGTPLSGRFDARPGTWGPRRQPLRIH